MAASLSILRRLAACLLLLLLPAICTHAQPAFISFSRLTLKDSLPDNNVNSVLEDRYGFVWIATEAGLARYDGAHMQGYTHLLRKAPGDRVVVSLLRKSPAGQVAALLDFRGLALFDDAANAFTVKPFRGPGGYGLPTDTVLNFLYAPDGSIIFSTYREGIFVYSPQGRLRVLLDGYRPVWPVGVRPPPGADMRPAGDAKDDLAGYKFDVPHTLALDGEGCLWAGQFGKGLLRIPLATGKAGLYRMGHKGGDWQGTDTAELASNLVTSLDFDGDHRLYIGTFTGLSRIDTRNLERRSFLYPLPYSTRPVMRTVCAAGPDRVYAGSEHGLYVYNLAQRVLREYKSSTGDPTGLVDNEVGRVVRTSDGAVWIFGGSGGLNFFHPGRQTHNQAFEEVIGILPNARRATHCREIAGGRLVVGSNDQSQYLYNARQQVITPLTGLNRLLSPLSNDVCDLAMPQGGPDTATALLWFTYARSSPPAGTGLVMLDMATGQARNLVSDPGGNRHFQLVRPLGGQRHLFRRMVDSLQKRSAG